MFNFTDEEMSYIMCLAAAGLEKVSIYKFRALEEGLITPDELEKVWISLEKPFQFALDSINPSGDGVAIEDEIFVRDFVKCFSKN